MSTIFAGRFNFGFLFFSLVIVSTLSADPNSTTTDITDLSKDINPAEEFHIDNHSSISTTLQTDNSIDGDLSLTSQIHTSVEMSTTTAENETEKLPTTETKQYPEMSHNASVEPKSIMITETSHQYNSLGISDITIVHVEGDQISTVSADVDASWTTSTTAATEPLKNNSIQHQERVDLKFIGNSLDDISNSSSENKTGTIDQTLATNVKPTNETIMGVGIKATVSVSLRVQDTKITATNLTEEMMNGRNSSCKSSLVITNSSEDTYSDLKNTTCYEVTETATDSTNESAHRDQVLQKSNSESSALNSTSESDQQNNTESSFNRNHTSSTEMEFNSPKSNNTEFYSNNRTDSYSNATHNSTEDDSNLVYHNNTENESNSTKLNGTEVNLVQNITDILKYEEPISVTETSTTEQRISDMTLSDNGTTEAYTDTSISRLTITNNETSEPPTTHIKTQAPTTSTTWSSTDTETDAELMTTTPQPIIKVEGVMKIVHGLNWSAELHERQSPQYKMAARNMQLLLEDVFSSTAFTRLLEVEIDGFSEDGMLVDYILTLIKSDALDPDYLVHTFNSYFRYNNTNNGFTIDPKATEFKVMKVKAITSTVQSRVEPPVPQWVVAVVVIAAASLVFIILFAAVTIYGRHYGRRSYNKKLQGDEIIFDKPDYQAGPRLSDAAYENLAADAVYDVEGSPEKIDGMNCNTDNQFDSWRSNRLARMPSSKRFSFNSS